MSSSERVTAIARSALSAPAASSVSPVCAVTAKTHDVERVGYRTDNLSVLVYDRYVVFFAGEASHERIAHSAAPDDKYVHKTSVSTRGIVPFIARLRLLYHFIGTSATVFARRTHSRVYRLAYHPAGVFRHAVDFA